MKKYNTQTNYPSPIKENQLTKEEKIEVIAGHFKCILNALGVDLTDCSVSKTPQRVAKMYVNEIFQGMDAENFPSMTTLPNDKAHGAINHMIFVTVSFTSFCEHHFVPMHGHAYVAYKPTTKLIGLSKIPRLVRYFAKRPQIQERLTAQIADALSEVVESDSVAVSISATHFCVIARGIEDQCSNTVTNVLKGDFEKDSSLRQEFFEAIQRENQHNPR